ncbi:MAG: DMT family transporter [Actinobacteria bacterium]|nr:MAG: DMT family transporter [Actinomycetota bacterium]
MPGPRGHLNATLIALFVTFLWSSSWVLIRWGLDQEGLSPITFASMRYGLAAMILLGWVAIQPRRRTELRSLDRKSMTWILLLGVIFYAITQGAQFVAIDSQPAATSSLILSWTPLLVALASSRSISEPVSGRQTLGALLVIAGAWTYFSGDLGATAIGVTASIVGLLANVVGSLLGRHVNRPGNVSPLVVTTLSMGIGSAILVATGLVAEGVPAVSGRALGIIVWLAVVNTAWAFTLWNLSLRRLSAIESAAINNTMLIQIAVLAWIFLDERIGVAEGAGILLVTVGILLTQKILGRRPTPAESPLRR